MSWFRNYVRSSVGAKHIMAITGLALVLFILVHMLGNLQLLRGQDALNSYAESLASTPLLVWGARAALLFLVTVHIAAGIRLTVLNKAARPVKYHVFRPARSPFYARVMPMSGVILLAFIIYHLLHFTLMPDAFVASGFSLEQNLGDHTRPDVYKMVVLGFQQPAIAISYIVAMALLCMHLAHGVSSFFQSLGFSHPKYDGFVRKSGPVFALIVFLGNCSMPIAVLAGAVKLPGA